MQVANVGCFENQNEKDTNFAADLHQEIEGSILSKSSRVTLSPSSSSGFLRSDSKDKLYDSAPDNQNQIRSDVPTSNDCRVNDEQISPKKNEVGQVGQPSHGQPSCNICFSHQKYYNLQLMKAKAEAPIKHMEYL